MNEWISIKDRLPEERDSVFKKVYGTAEWNNAMFRTISNDVLITLKYEDGTRLVTTGRTRDGKWRFPGIRQATVTHWMTFPEPPKGE